MIDPKMIAEWKRDAERDVIPGCDAPGIVLPLLAEREENLALLREVEWSPVVTGGRCCPWCFALESNGHSPACRLAAFLKGTP